MKIKMVDLKLQYDKIKEELDASMQEVIDSTSFINGPMVSKFADNLSEYIGCENIVTCANGTDALQIALMALDLKAGDEVIVPDFTYVASAEVIALLGLKPVFVDCRSDSFNIDIDSLRSAITYKTKAIVVVHLYGQCADMESILTIAKESGLFLIEDTAQAIGADFIFSNGSKAKAGTMGDIGTTSFFPSKNLGCYGDGGALFVNDKNLANKVKMIANHGQSVKYKHDIIGCNSRLDSLQAAVLNVKLKYLNDYIEARQSVADFYDKSLRDIYSIITPVNLRFSTHVYHQYTIKVLNGLRDDLKLFLSEKGIPSMVYYPIPLHRQLAFKDCKFENVNNSEDLSKEVLSLPIHTEMNEEQLNFICSAIHEFFERY
ncbi:DegT/DnrJ/EryC1/StrS family aminotransferase [Marinilabiliaceae bacterium JC040]|nr:DegT/DnrJ/EryC1/StrS family aminotransferase [Marinilabiliaceae bacterium JC040]